MFITLASAASITSKGAETAKQSNVAVDQLLQFLWDKIDNWIAAVVVVIFSFFIAKLLKRLAVDKISNHIDDEHQDVLILTGRATYVAVLSVGLTVGLKIAGIDITAIVAAIGFGVGFAMKDLIMNFAAGVMILLSRQFTIGDFISIGQTSGTVSEIQSRCTILQALDGTKIIVPNADIFSKEVVSYTTNPFRRIDFQVGVDYKTDLKKAVEIILKTMQNCPDVVPEPKPNVIISQFGASSIDLNCLSWVESRAKWMGIRSNMIIDVKKNFDAAGINIPFPITTIYMAKDEVQSRNEASVFAGTTPDKLPRLCPEPIPVTPQVEPIAPVIVNQSPPPVETPKPEVVTPKETPTPTQIPPVASEEKPADSGEAFLNKVQNV